MHSFVVPSMRPRRPLLERCLAALGRETRGMESEVLVVVEDEAAAAGLDGFATADLDVRAVLRPGGAAARRNAAFAELRGDVIALLDDDAEPLEGYGAALCAQVADGAPHLVQGAIWPDFAAPPPAELAPVIFSVGGFNRFEDRCRDDVFISANCAFSRPVLEQVGPMREDLGPGSGGVPWGDDTEWHQRAREGGVETVFDEAMAVRHRVEADRLTVDAVLERAEKVGRTLARLEWDGRRPGLGALVAQRALGLWGGLKAGGDLGRRCVARRHAGYADEVARMRGGVPPG